MMRIFIVLFALLWFQAWCLAESPGHVFHVQLIRGSDREQPEQVAWKAIGPKLSKKLGPKFRWKHYWEVARQEVSVHPDKPARVRLSHEREVEIELHGDAESEVRLYRSGKLVRKSRQSLPAGMTIMGGGGEESECWFIVVRRDRPSVG
jgi:hypothetical protein